MWRAYRSDNDAVVFGVCGGIGQVVGLDTNLVRLAFAILALASGVGIALYLLLAVVMPPKEALGAPPREMFQYNLAKLVQAIPQRKRSLGIVLVVAGAVVLAGKFGLFDWITWERAWPLILILVGLALVMRKDD